MSERSERETTRDRNILTPLRLFKKWKPAYFKKSCYLGELQGELAGHPAHNSLVREELQRAAAGGDLAHGVTAALAEPCCGWRLVVDVHWRVGPLCWWGTRGRAEQTAEARDRKRPRNKIKGAWGHNTPLIHNREATGKQSEAVSPSWKLPCFKHRAKSSV